MIKINIKPLSVNQAWGGRTFKSNKYKQYEKDLPLLLPALKLPKPPYSVYYEFGFSSAASDLDNPIKPLTDILQRKYNFNDKHIHEMIVRKFKVKKGDEYIKFEIKQLEQ